MAIFRSHKAVLSTSKCAYTTQSSFKEIFHQEDFLWCFKYYNYLELRNICLRGTFYLLRVEVIRFCNFLKTRVVLSSTEKSG